MIFILPLTTAYRLLAVKLQLEGGQSCREPPTGIGCWQSNINWRVVNAGIRSGQSSGKSSPMSMALTPPARTTATLTFS